MLAELDGRNSPNALTNMSSKKKNEGTACKTKHLPHSMCNMNG